MIRWSSIASVSSPSYGGRTTSTRNVGAGCRTLPLVDFPLTSFLLGTDVFEQRIQARDLFLSLVEKEPQLRDLANLVSDAAGKRGPDRGRQ